LLALALSASAAPPNAVIEPRPQPPRIIPVQKVEPVPTDAPDALRDQSLFEPPSSEAIFSRLDSEKMFEQRLRQQGIQKTPPEIVKFPDRPVLTKATYTPRSFPPAVCYAEPAFVCYNRLYFEEKNAERYGWDLGFIQPVVSVAYFYKDILFLPHHIAQDPWRRFECNAGYCLPGDSVPYILYPPDITLGGSIVEAAVVVGMIAMFHGL
jgi:hypothetical protein